MKNIKNLVDSFLVNASFYSHMYFVNFLYIKFRLDKKLSNILRRNDISTSDISEDGKTTSIDSLSITSSVSQIPPRITLSGPVTDL